MNNGQIIALVGVSISVVSIGLLVAVNLSVQSDLRTLNNNLATQSEQIKSLNSQLKASQEIIDNQKTTITQLQSDLDKTNSELRRQNDELKSSSQLISNMQGNMTLMQDRLKSLTDRVNSLEQRLRPQPCLFEGCPSPTPKSECLVNSKVIGDGGFESSELLVDGPCPVGHWGSTGTRFGGIATITNEDKHSGSYSLKIASGSSVDASKAGYVYQFFNLGTSSYTLSFWYKGIEGNTMGEVLTGWGPPPWWLGGIYEPKFGATIQLGGGFPVDDQWHQVKIVNTPSKMSKYLDDRLILSESGRAVTPSVIIFGDISMSEGGGTFYIDDVSLLEQTKG